MEIFDFLNNNSGSLTTLFTFVVAISTVAYVCLTRSLVHETKKIRQAQTDPQVDVTLELSEEHFGVVNMLVANIGLGPAYDLAFSYQDASEQGESKTLVEELNAISFLRSGVRYLGPGQRLRTSLTSLHGSRPEGFESRVGITVRYHNSNRTAFSEEYQISPSEFTGIRRTGTPPLEEIAKAAKEIQRRLSQIAPIGSKRLSVDSFNSQDRQKEKQARDAAIRKADRRAREKK